MIIFIAVAAGQVAPAHGNKMSKYRMAAREQGPADEARLAQFKLKKFRSSHVLEGPNPLRANFEEYATQPPKRKIIGFALNKKRGSGLSRQSPTGLMVCQAIPSL